jgi:SSS family solute:Na+ symporter
MNGLDWGIVAVYLLGLVVVACLIGRHQKTLRDYYLSGHRIRWWQSGFSTMATQMGAISFVSAPAFVAVADDGGLKWICYELGVPFGILIVMAVILPVLHSRRYLSIYEYLEQRFDRGVRAQIGVLFQLGRGLATAVSVLAGGLILSTAIDISTPLAIVVIGSLTVVYALVGGQRAVVLSDVLQMGVVLLGIVICGGLAFSEVGWTDGWEALGPDRIKILDFSRLGLREGETYAFWPMLLGGIFLYASYYGCDQSQVQRELSVGSLGEARKSLLLNAFGRFPMVLLYCLTGVFVGAALLSPEGLDKAALAMALPSDQMAGLLADDPDRMLPVFILSFLPHGVIGFIFIAVLSALMSSLDSAINSLSAVTVRDFYQVYMRPEASEAHYLRVSKLFTALWGVFCILASLFFYLLSESTRQTTIVLINAVGSLLYGPILATFLLGMLTHWADAKATKIAVWAGIGANLIVWCFTDISWLWWNAVGLLVTIVTAAICSKRQIVRGSTVLLMVDDPGSRVKGQTAYLIIGIYFFLMVLFCWGLERTITT